MIERLFVVRSERYDPWYNLALEQCLMDTARQGEVLLYLWRNDRTVVIGRSQSAYAECDLEGMAREGVLLARRSSGGGAVYQDLGNLCFTFLGPAEEMHTNRQMQIVLDSLRSWGLEGVASGRNDILVAGRKVSGSAFQERDGVALHHGTLLVSADLNAMERFLRPDREKLRANAVPSVRARVVNLQDLNPSIEMEALQGQMIRAAEAAFGCPAEDYDIGRIERARLEEQRALFASDVWRLGRARDCSHRLEERFHWGGIRLGLCAAGGVVEYARLETDGLDPDFPQICEGLLLGAPARLEDLCRRLTDHPWEDSRRAAMARDLAGCLMRSGLPRDLAGCLMRSGLLRQEGMTCLAGEACKE